MSKIHQIRENIDQFIVENNEQLESFRLQFLSKKAALQELLGEIKNVAPELRKDFGQQVNELKQLAQQMYDNFKNEIEASVEYCLSDIDVTKPVSLQRLGSMHPVSIVLNQVCEIFEKVGFVTVSGPDIEDDWHVFSALNFAPEHPARDMQDTFFVEINPDMLLRTHTSSIQVRTMVEPTSYPSYLSW